MLLILFIHWGGVLNRLLEQLIFFIDPLFQAGDSVEDLSSFLKIFGLDIPANSLASLSNWENFQTATADLGSAISNLNINDASTYVAIGTAASGI